MERHSDNALKLARWLQEHEAVDWVSHPGLPTHPDYDKAKKYLPKGQGAIFTFGIKGGVEAGRRLIDNLELFSIWPTWGMPNLW